MSVWGFIKVQSSEDSKSSSYHRHHLHQRIYDSQRNPVLVQLYDVFRPERLFSMQRVDVDVSRPAGCIDVNRSDGVCISRATAGASENIPFVCSSIKTPQNTTNATGDTGLPDTHGVSPPSGGLLMLRQSGVK